MNENVLIIPDVHNRISRVKIIIKAEQADQVIFLGDFFDDFGDSPTQAEEVAAWLKENLHNDKYVFLWGNHDVGYSFNNQFCYCSGYEKDKDIAVKGILKQKDWDRFKWFYWLDEKTLLSHAGLCYGMAEQELGEVPNLELVKKLLHKEDDKASMALRKNKSHWFFRAGYSRGGRQIYGGLVWADWYDDFKGIEDVKQVFGHTPLHKPDAKDDSLCLDTHLNHYAVWNNGVLVIKKYVDL